MENENDKWRPHEILLSAALIIVATVMGFGLWWCFRELSVIKQKQHELQNLLDQKQIRSEADKKKQVCQLKTEGNRILIDPNNPGGQKGWKSKYAIQLKPVNRITEQFGVNWYRPHKVATISTDKPDSLNALPKFKYEIQRYLTLRLGDAENNQIIGVMDFSKPDRQHFPFDLYLDRDRDGNLAEDFIDDRTHMKGIKVPYKDGTTEDYSLHLYSYSNEPIGVAYQSHAGRYGILEADQKRIQILVIDNTGNGVFNDDDDVILMDWDIDGKLDGTHQANEHRPLYSLLKLRDVSYRVVQLDAPGRHMVLRRTVAK